MTNLQQAQQLLLKLTGPSCIVSRIKPVSDARPSNFLTLHSLAGKVIYQVYGWSNFKGEDMLQNVREALQKLQQRAVSKKEVLDHYYAIREHKNELGSLGLFSHGQDLLNRYEKSLDQGYDFEDCLQHATWLLKNVRVPQWKFPYSNIVLIQPELLYVPSNKNALDFFKAFTSWAPQYHAYSLENDALRPFPQSQLCKFAG